jgi:hypothetical protein
VNSPDGAKRDVEAGARTWVEIIRKTPSSPVEAASRIFAGPRRVVLIAAGRLWSSAACPVEDLCPLMRLPRLETSGA